MARAWLFQDYRRKQELGEKKCPWSVGWIDPDGKRKSKTMGSKSMATKHARKLEGQLASGSYQSDNKSTWEQFRKQYELQVLSGKNARDRQLAKESIDKFEELARPGRMRSITTETIDGFIAKRRAERGKVPGTTVSPATVNKDLRYIKAALNVAVEYGYLDKLPKIKRLKEHEKMPTYVSPEHFAKLYEASRKSTRPGNVPNVDPVDWWKALLVAAYMTGWRIGQLLSLRWADVDLDARTAMSRSDATGNKGKRDERIPLHPIVADHLRKLSGSFDSRVFPWDECERYLYDEFEAIQKSAGLADVGKNGRYGFHDLRRGFATQNAEGMDLFQLQALMQHQSLETTKLYVNMAKRLNRVVEGLYVPDVLKTGAAS